jgi:hypothetical protein
LKVDKDLLREFEENLNPAKPEKSKIPIKVLGYGEISTVFEILLDEYSDVAFKRIPMFRSVEQVERYIQTYYEYIDFLSSAGIRIPGRGAEYIVTKDGRIVLFLIQEKLDPSLVCNKVIQRMKENEAVELFDRVLNEMKKVWDFNAKKVSESLEIGLDGQISNWALSSEDTSSDLLYFDTSTPMIRKNGIDQLETDIFLRACPPGVRILLKKFFLQDILDRYYDFRKVVVDLIANLFKEKRADFIPSYIDFTNRFFDEIGYRIEPITYKEVEKYYKEDAFIWSLYLNLRKIHRFIVTKILLKRYEFILPGKIKR